MLESIRLRNVRSFSNEENSPFIEIKPITVLVGKNSSGKSTFARTFPLLRQSVETKKTGPILWYGNYVDFGSFKEARNKTSKSEVIYIDLKINTNIYVSRRWPEYRYHMEAAESPELMGFDVECRIGVREEDNKTVAHSVDIFIEGVHFEIVFGKDNSFTFSVDGTPIDLGCEFFSVNSNKALPEIFCRRVINKKENTFRISEIDFDNYFTNIIYDSLKNYFHGRTEEEKIKSWIRSIKVCHKNNFPEYLRKVFKASTSFNKNDDLFMRYISEGIFVQSISKNFIDIYSSISDHIVDIFKGVRYIAPLRASSERYYRYQDLQVDEINHTGSNLAMLLRSLNGPQSRKFSQWTHDNFGFSVRVEEQGLHCAIMIKVEDQEEFNINDMGFGFSQILPIIVSVWMETSNNRKSYFASRFRSVIFSIEQPELHLHPEFQEKTAVLFCNVIKYIRSTNSRVRFIIETHSQTMINAFGDAIEKGVIDSDSVNIVLFEKQNFETNVSFSSFDDSGYLINWPIGFFSR